MRKERSRDRRVQRTHDLLHGALASLIHEKPYDAIVIKEILARANVGRSTFYTHFRDKDELLVRAIRDMMRAGDSTLPATRSERAEWLLRFSAPVLEHIDGFRRAAPHSAHVRGQPVVHERLRQVLTQLIAEDMQRADVHDRRGKRDGVPLSFLAEHIASTFVLLLNWWVERGATLSAAEVNDVFRAVILPTLLETPTRDDTSDARGAC